ncbi:hypothetical protein BU17DRAFT_60681 [Hysterangium stoloniferum]|nr:hypothetical protein BU17DRAFT_60681 [Hysterangium stoloniferum]
MSQVQHNFEAVAIEYSADNAYSIGTVRSDVYQYIVKGHLRKLLPTHATRNVEIIREIDGSNIILVRGLSGDKTIRQRLTDISNKVTDDIASELKGMQILAVNLGVNTHGNSKQDDGDIEEIESPSKRPKPSHVHSKASGLFARSKSKKRDLLTAGTSLTTPFAPSSASQVTATRPLPTTPPTAVVFQPVIAGLGSPKRTPEHDLHRGVSQADDADNDEVVIVECKGAPSTSNFLYQSKDEALRKASNVIREVMTKITEDETERLKLEGALRQRIVAIEEELKSERLARQLAERLLVTPPAKDLPEPQQRIAELEKKLAKKELEMENMRKLAKAFVEKITH